MVRWSSSLVCYRAVEDGDRVEAVPEQEAARGVIEQTVEPRNSNEVYTEPELAMSAKNGKTSSQYIVNFAQDNQAPDQLQEVPPDNQAANQLQEIQEDNQAANQLQEAPAIEDQIQTPRRRRRLSKPPPASRMESSDVRLSPEAIAALGKVQVDMDPEHGDVCVICLDCFGEKAWPRVIVHISCGHLFSLACFVKVCSLNFSFPIGTYS